MTRLRPAITIAAATLLLVASWAWIHRPDEGEPNPYLSSGDFAGFLVVGDLALQGKDIYLESPRGLNTWPPFFGVLCIPLAILARPTPLLARGFWLLLNYVLLWRTLQTISILVYGMPLRLIPRDGDLTFTSAEIFVPVALCARFILGNFEHLQANIVLFALAVETFRLHVQGRDVLAGCTLGLSASIKIMPVLLIGYFLFRRRFRVALWGAAAAAAFSLSPALIYGWPAFLHNLHSWSQAVNAGWSVGKMNQSLRAMLDRYLGLGIRPWNVIPLDNVSPSGSSWPVVAWVALTGAIAADAVGAFSGDSPPGSLPSLLEYSAVLVISDLLGPVAWKAYFVNLLLPCVVLVALLRSRPFDPHQRRMIVGALSLYVALAALPFDLFAHRLGKTLEMLSGPTLGVLTLYFLLLQVRRWVAAEGREAVGK